MNDLDLLPFELEPQPEEQQRFWLHYEDAEGFEDWWHPDCPQDMAEFNKAAAENNERGITWSCRLVPMD